MPPASDDEYDNFPDDFENIDLSNVPGLSYDDAAATIPVQSSPRPQPLDEALSAPVAAAATPSDHYSFDELDDTFLAEVDELDQLLTQDVARTQPVEETPAATQPVTANTNAEAGSSLYAASSSASIEEVDKELGSMNDRQAQATSRFFERAPAAVAPSSPPRPPRSPRRSPKKGVEINEPIPWSPTPKTESSPRKRARAGSSTPTQLTPAKKHKGKEKESPSAGVRRILSEFEDEMTCPICCDIFAAAHLGNPCGHSFCGECGWNWIAKNPRAPTCAICRATLSAVAPMIPNFAMDNTIEKQLHALGQNGIDDWEEGGSKLAEWRARKEKWKAGAAERAKGGASAQRAPVQRTHPLERELSGSFIVPDDEEDEDYSESDEEDEGGSGGTQSTQENVPGPPVGVTIGAWQSAARGGPPPHRRNRPRWNRGGNSNNNGNGRGGRGYRGNRGGGRGGGGRGGRGRGRGNFGRGGAA